MPLLYSTCNRSYNERALLVLLQAEAIRIAFAYGKLFSIWLNLPACNLSCPVSVRTLCCLDAGGIPLEDMRVPGKDLQAMKEDGRVDSPFGQFPVSCGDETASAAI